MAAENYFELGSVIWGAVEFGQVSSAPIDPGVEQLKNGSVGELNDSFFSWINQEPSVNIQSSDLKKVLDTLGQKGVKIKADVDPVPLEVYALKLEDGGTYTAGATHSKAQINSGYMVPMSITGGDNEQANINMMVHVTGDGTNNPIVYSNNVADPGVVDDDRVYTLGYISVNGVKFRAETFNFNFGIGIVKKSDSGVGYPIFVGYNSQKPEITFNSNDYAELATLDPTGTSVAGDVVIAFKRMQKGGGRYADSATEHITFTFKDGCIKPNTIPLAKKEQGMLDYAIEPLWDKVNSFMVVDTAAALS